MFRTFVLALLMTAMLCSVSSAEDLAKMQDRFFGGLAVIIEENMNDPEGCIREVDEYYQDNQALIAKMQKELEKAMAQVAPMMQTAMDKYQSMSEEELEALERRQQGMQGMPREPGGQESAEMKRYSKALEAFTEKHPMRAMKIAMKAMVLMSSSSTMPAF